MVPASVTSFVHNFSHSLFSPVFPSHPHSNVSQGDEGGHVPSDNQEPATILDPGSLTEHFSGQAAKNTASTSSHPKIFALTDAKIAYKPDGTSTKVWLCGLSKQRRRQRKRNGGFDGSFIDSMRIGVEVVDVSSLQFPVQNTRLRCFSANSPSLGN